MKKGNSLAWLMLTVWAAVAIALQLAWAHRVVPFGGPAGWWLPDWTLALLVALGVHVPLRHVWKVWVLLALVRIAYTGDAPVVVLAAYGWVALLIQGLRSGVEVSGPMPRTAIAFFAAMGVAMWSQGVHMLRHTLMEDGGMSFAPWLELARQAFPAALVTCGIVGLFGSAFARLPGLSPLYQRQRF